MFKTKKSILYLTFGIIVLILTINFSLGIYLSNRSQANSKTNSSSVVVSDEQATKNTFSYKGEEGKDALFLLKQSAKSVEQNGTGLVIAINNRKADDIKKEYWAFYVNGKMAGVGPADYKTKDGDRIEWKIDHY